MTTIATLSPLQGEYLHKLYPAVRRMIRSLTRTVPSHMRNDVQADAVADFCRRAVKLPVCEIEPDTLPVSIVRAVRYAVRTAKRRSCLITSREADILTVAVDVATYRAALANESAANFLADIDDDIDSGISGL